MKKVLVVDTEPRWCDFCQSLGYEVVGKPTSRQLEISNYDVYIISSLQIDLLPLPSLAGKVIIATAQLTNDEALRSYRLGAINYIVKDLREDIIRKKVEGNDDLLALCG